MTLYQYVILHESVRNHPGVCACQAAHAAAESVRELPVPEDTNVCALMAESSADLEALHDKLERASIPHVIIHEPDPPYDGAATAVGIAPCERSVARDYVKHFRILR